MSEHISDDDLRNLRTSASLTTPGPYFSCGGKANARVQARVPLSGGGYARYILCALTRSGWRDGSQVQNDAYFLSLLSPERVTALVNEVLERRKADTQGPVISIIIKDGWPEQNSGAPIVGAPRLSDGTYELYTAPQPAPVVSEELLSAMEEVIRISDRDHSAWERVKSAIAECRAAMLQAGNSPAFPGWVMAPAKANIAMIKAGGKAAREHLEEYGGNSPQVIYQAMLAAAPQPAPKREQVRCDYAEDVNSQLVARIGIYERIYGPLRECPGGGSIYSASPSEGERIPHGVLAHTGCVSFYCNFGHLHIAEPAAITGCHTHSLSGGTNDAKS